MFDHHDSGIGLSEEYLCSGGSHDDDVVFEATCRALTDDRPESVRDVIPDDLEEIPTGPYLAAVVISVDRRRLNGHDVVRLMQAEARLAASFEAGELASMVEVALSPPGNADSEVERSPDVMEYAAVEIATALTLTRRAAETRLDHALALHGPLTRVWQRFATGHIGFRKVREFVNSLGHLPSTLIEGVLDRCLDASSNLTTGQLRARLSRLVMEADPDGSESSFEQGVEDRKVVTYSNPDFTASLGILSADPSDVAAAMAHVERIARHLKTDDEPRTLDQIRNDVAVDLLRGKRFGMKPGGGRVKVTVPAATLERLANEPGSIDGYGPVIAEIARKTALENVDGAWVFAVTDNGRTVATGTLARRPTEAQTRRIRADYPTCTFPGCRRPAYHCDLDHRKPFSRGGPTHNDNLGPLCRHHHMAKHHAPWQLERLPNGDHRWTSPLSHTYVRPRGPPV
ncbi:MAG: DUF222 domain-containing protein [Acidimicrobiia bacterium]